MILQVAGEDLAAYGAIGGPCLLVHGAGLDAGFFRQQIAAVEGAWAIDLPGHGASPGEGRSDAYAYAGIVLEMLARYGKPGTVLAGHSMGGAIALAAALREPSRLGGLALISTGGRLRVHPELLASLAAGQMPPDFRRSMVESDHKARLLERLPKARNAVEYGDYLACDRFDVLGRLGEIQLPTLVVVGSEDRHTPKKYARRLAEDLHGELHVVPGSGHMLPIEAPEALSSLLDDFLHRVT